MIAGGTYASLAVKNDGSVTSWGANFFNLTNLPAGLSNVVEVAGGSYHSLAIRNDGTVVAWGDNSAGQTNVPPSATNVVAIAGGNYHSLALRNDGTVVAWGDNSSGQTNVPPGLSNVVAVAAGGFHSLALKSDGTVVGWGDNTAGQALTPAGLTNVVAISSGYFHSLALTPTLLSTNPIMLTITNNEPQTNSVLTGGLIYYRVDVPTNVDAATNMLLFAINGGLNIWYSTNTPPTVGSPDDFLLLTNAVNGTSIVDTATSPQLIPGSTYYLGVQNTNNFPVSYVLQVDFHFFTNSGPITNPVPISTITQTNINGTNGFLLVWFAPTNEYFMVQWSPNLLGPYNTFTNIVGYHTFIDPTNSEFEFFDDGSQTGGFSSGRFYRLISLNSTPPPATNPPPPLTTAPPISTVTQTNNGFLLVWYAPTNALFQVQWSSGLLGPYNTFTNIIGYHTYITPTNSEFEFFDDGSQDGGLGTGKFYRLILLNPATVIPTLPADTTVSNSAPSGSVAFYQVNVPANADVATNLLLSGTGPLNVWLSTNSPPTVTNVDDFLLITNLTTGASILSNNIPRLAPGGTYYLGVQNTNAGAVTYSVRVDFHLVAPLGGSTNPVPISSIVLTNIGGTNNFLLTWFAPTNDLFQVQYSSTLPPTWNTFSNIVSYSTYVSPTNSIFTFLDDGSQSGGLGSFRFYRLLLSNGSVSNSGVIPLTDGVAVSFTTAAGATNFFSFDITQTNAAVLFELYNLTGNGDLTVQRDTLPVTSPYFASSTNPGTNYEQIVIRTNSATHDINAVSWFLGVPNQSSNPISYMIRATLPTNGML